MTFRYFSTKQLRERQNALRSLKFYDLLEEQERQDELIKVQEELKRRGSENPGGSANPVENLEKP